MLVVNVLGVGEFDTGRASETLPENSARVVRNLADTLRDLGCDYLQGYLIARPGPAFVDPV